MSKILIVSAVFPPEPVVSASLSRDIAEELSKNNDVVVLCPQPTRPEGFKFPNEYETESYEIIRVNSYTCAASKMTGRFRESYSFGYHCVKYIKEHSGKIDAIYINSWPLFAQYLVVKVAKKLNIRCIIHVQDIYPESLINKLKHGRYWLYKMLLPIDKYSLNNSKKIICISDNMKNALVKSRNLSSSKAVVIANWQNEDSFIRFKNSKIRFEKDFSTALTFMYLGNNGPLANADFLIRSFVKANIPESKLVIAGSGSRTNSCKDLAKSLQATNIEFLPVPEGMVPEIQDKADVMLLSVMKNGAISSIPSKLPAYMFSSKPIIGSLDTASDTAKAIIESNCGIVVEPENEERLINAMEEISKWSTQVLNNKGEAGFNYGMLHFSKKVNLPKVVSIIQSVSDGN